MSTKSKNRISVLLITYNHEKYIHHTLNNLFSQIIDETIEVIVADDSSTDNTIKIIKQYDGKDERFIFHYLDSSENLGITQNYKRGFAACSGDYVAVLEGDDYWISPHKLQRQISFLDTHWECNVCSVNYLVFEEYRLHFYPRTTIGDGHRLISARDLIHDNLVGNFSTCMYRNSALKTLPKKLFDLRSYDWIVNICLTRDSLLGFLEEPMSVYRLHTNGVWSKTSFVDKLKVQLELIPEYNLLTENVFSLEFDQLSTRLKQMIYSTNVESIVVGVKPSIKIVEKLKDYLPPIIIWIIKALIPNKLINIINKS